jgi:hypothetical protein
MGPPLINVVSPGGGANTPVDPTIISGTSSNFTVNFGQMIFKPGTKFRCTIVSFTNSILNVSPAIGNNTFGWISPSDVTTTIPIPSGNYDIGALNGLIQNSMKLAGATFTNSDGSTGYYINIGANLNTLEVVVSVSNSYSLDLSVGTLWQWLGFASSLVISATTTAPNVCDILPVTTLLLNASFVNSSYRNGVISKMFAVVPLTLNGIVTAGGLISVQYTYPIAIPLAYNMLEHETFSVTDQNGNPIDLQNQQISFSLIFEEP